jgi:probable HAF family extracellular repeat protein
MTTYTFSTLDEPSATGDTDVYGINDTGQIVGDYADSLGAHGFLATALTETTYMFSMPLDAPSSTGTSAYGINAAGQIVGGYEDSTGMPHGFLYSGGSYTILNATLGTNGTLANGINAADQIVGQYFDSNNTVHGFLYNGGSYTTLDESLGTNGTIAYGINNTGQIVGEYADSSGTAHGFLYSGGSYITLDDPSATNGTIAFGINDTGQIVGEYFDSSGTAHGFLYSGGTYTTIDDTLGTNGTIASSINNAGQIVGEYIDSSGVAHGFLATSAGTTSAIFPFTGDALSQVETIYIAYFGRAGDPGGTNYWVGQLNSGALNIQGGAASFSVQAEATAEYPFLASPLGASTSGTGNALDQFINSVYENLFGRVADGTDTTGGLGYWRTQILNALATNVPGTIANEFGVFCLQVAFGAQATDQTVLANKVTVADAITQAFSANNIQYGNTGSAADHFAHNDIASVTASAASVTAAEVAITGIIPSLI